MTDDAEYPPTECDVDTMLLVRYAAYRQRCITQFHTVPQIILTGPPPRSPEHRAELLLKAKRDVARRLGPPHI